MKVARTKSKSFQIAQKMRNSKEKEIKCKAGRNIHIVGESENGIRTEPSWSSAVARRWLSSELARSRRSRWCPMGTSLRLSVAAGGFLSRRFSCPSATWSRCRLFSGKIKKKKLIWPSAISMNRLTVIFMLILMVSPSLKPRSRMGFGSAFSFSSASAFFTYLKWSCSATLKSNESDRSCKWTWKWDTSDFLKTIETHPKSDSDERGTAVVVLYAQHEVPRAVGNGLDGHSGISFDGAVRKQRARNFIFKFDVQRSARRHHSHPPIPCRLV